MNIVAAALLAQLVGGVTVVAPANVTLAPAVVEVASLPTCGPTLVLGTPCVWRALSRQAFSTKTPGRYIWVAVIAERPTFVSPGAEPPQIFVRRSAFDFSIDWYISGDSSCRGVHEEFVVREQYGAPCQE